MQFAKLHTVTNNKPIIKICCIKSEKELDIILGVGIEHVGFVSYMPSGPGIISDSKIRMLVRRVPKQVKTFLLTSLEDPHKIARQQAYCGANTVQLCAPMAEKEIKKTKELLPDVCLIKVIHVISKNSKEEAIRIQNYVDGILLDTGNPYLSVPILGGTGRVHNWDISKEICASVPVPVLLAGGLNYENVIAAFEKVKPYGLDVCNGVRTNDKLDEGKLKLFINKVKRLKLNYINLEGKN